MQLRGNHVKSTFQIFLRRNKKFGPANRIAKKGLDDSFDWHPLVQRKSRSIDGKGLIKAFLISFKALGLVFFGIQAQRPVKPPTDVLARPNSAKISLNRRFKSY